MNIQAARDVPGAAIPAPEGKGRPAGRSRSGGPRDFESTDTVDGAFAWRNEEPKLEHRTGAAGGEI